MPKVNYTADPSPDYCMKCNELITFCECESPITDYDDMVETILDIIDSENSGLSHQQRLNEIKKLIT